MTSAAEQLAANISWSTFAKATDLKKRLLFVLGALIVYRLGTFLPLPMISADAVQQALNLVEGQAGNAFSLLNVFSGGAIERMSIFALNIMPYISASIVVQLMTAVVPSLEKLKKEGEAGRKKINQYTRFGTVALAAVQAWGLAVGLESVDNAVSQPGMFFRLTTVVTVVGGTLFLMWLGEQITQRGVGNGISLLIFAGIVAEMPGSIAQLFELGRQGAIPTLLVVLVLVMLVALVFGVVFMERAQRRILVQYPRQQRGNQMYGGGSTHLPLKLNPSGVIPPIFASSLLLLPSTLIGFAGENSPGWVQFIGTALSRGSFTFMIIYFGLIVFFCFFYTALVFNPKDTADALKRNGGFIPGVRPGQATADFIDHVMTRLLVVGAGYIGLICILPEFLFVYNQSIPFLLGGTSMLIMVTVTMDTVGQIQSHLLAHQYEGAIRKSRLKGRRR